MIHPVYFSSKIISQRKELLVSKRRRISISKEFRVQTRLRQSYERRLRSQMRSYFKSYFDEYAFAMDSDMEFSIVNARYERQLTQILDSHYKTVIRAFGLRLLNQYTKQEEQFELIYRDYVRENVGTKVVLISVATRKHIQRIIQKNIDAGLGVSALATQIRAEGTGSFSRYRSATIARTETHNAASFANHRIAQTQNLPNQRKRWIATQDNRSRDAHLSISGTTLPIDEDFVVNGSLMGYAGDPRGGVSNVVNCRCVIIYLSDLDEIIG